MPRRDQLDEPQLDPYYALIDRATAAGGAIDFDALTSALGDVVMEDYRGSPVSPLVQEFTHGPAVYLHAESSAHDARTILAIGRPVPPAANRDAAYQRGYPVPESWAGRPVDRGHFLPYSGGGLYGPNLYVQDRALNRGWSRDGRSYRRLERDAVAGGLDTVMFARPRYVDSSAVPATIDIGVIADNRPQVERFRNRFDEVATAGLDPLDVALCGATDAQIGALGEEAAGILLEQRWGATIVAMGDAGLEREQGRQHLDLLVVIDGAPVAIEVKTRYTSSRAGRLTRAGNLPRPRLRRTGSRGGHRQASQLYVSARVGDWIDVNGDFPGMDVRVVAVDFVAMFAQQFAVNDAGTALVVLGSPVSCKQEAREALAIIATHRGHL